MMPLCKLPVDVLKSLDLLSLVAFFDGERAPLFMDHRSPAAGGSEAPKGYGVAWRAGWFYGFSSPRDGPGCGPCPHAASIKRILCHTMAASGRRLSLPSAMMRLHKEGLT
jgi:hypothetical protein